MSYSVYMNGIFQEVLDEIVNAQDVEPELICFLQPYSDKKIVELAKSQPSVDSSIPIYISLTSSLDFVSYKAEVVGWEFKPEIEQERLVELNEHIHKHQPIEGSIYMTGGKGQPCVNLLFVVNMKKLAIPIPVTSLVKISNNEPLKTRTTSGGWAYEKTFQNGLVHSAVLSSRIISMRN